MSDRFDEQAAELLPCSCRVQVVADDGPLAGSYHQSDCRSRLQSAVASALRAGDTQARAEKWQAIDTAPKDGTRILLQLNRRVVCGQWDTDSYGKKSRPYWTNDTEHLWGKTSTRADQPTRWMKLPAPEGESK